jgi:hypothetical protein
MHRLRLGRLLEARVKLVVEGARAVHRGHVLRHAGQVGRAVVGIAERAGKLRREVRAAVQPEHGDDAPGEERLDDLCVGIALVAVRATPAPRLAAQDLALEPPKLLAGLDPQLVECSACVGVCL